MRSILFRLSSLVLAAAVCGLVTPASAQFPRPNLGGETTGSWDLPSSGSAGAASGVLLDASGNVAFTMDAALTQTMSSRGKTQGVINGTLSDAGGNPVWQVTGTWSSKRGTGTFQASIGISFGNLFLLIGGISGKFDDSGKGVGVYKGVWFFQQF